MKKRERDRKRTAIIIISIILFFIALLLIKKFYVTGKYVTGKSVNEQITIVPLSYSENGKVEGILESSQFIRDMPNKGIISLRFFKFENGERVWQSGFLMGKNAILNSGNPDIYLSLHSKYIPELNKDNLCEVIGKAKNNGDLGYYSDKNKASLMLKYAGMLKYAKCVGLSL